MLWRLTNTRTKRLVLGLGLLFVAAMSVAGFFTFQRGQTIEDARRSSCALHQTSRQALREEAASDIARETRSLRDLESGRFDEALQRLDIPKAEALANAREELESARKGFRNQWPIDCGAYVRDGTIRVLPVPYPKQSP